MATVFIPAQMRDLTAGQARIEVQAESVAQAVEQVDRLYPGFRQRLCVGDMLQPGLQVSIDDVMTTRGLRAKLRATSEVHFLPAIGGG